MIDLLPLLLINSLYIFGFSNATEYSVKHLDCYGKTMADPNDREILWFIRWGLRNAPKYIQNPVCYCVVCMASLHSWPYLLLHPEITIVNAITYIIYIFALSGFNSIVNDRLSA